MLDLNTLREALAPLSEIGRDEASFEVGGIEVVIRPLLPLEEVAVQRYAAAVLDDVQKAEGLSDTDQMSRAAALDYFDRFRIEIIAHAVIEVGGTDLREATNIPTGEILKNGTPVQMPRAMAMRGIVEGWSRAMITICFSKYGDLMQKIADEADRAAGASVADMDVEIDRVENRLRRLRTEREQRAKGDPSITSQQIKSLISAGEQMKKDVQASVDEVQHDVDVANAMKAAKMANPSPPPQKEAPVEEDVEEEDWDDDEEEDWDDDDEDAEVVETAEPEPEPGMVDEVPSADPVARQPVTPSASNPPTRGPQPTHIPGDVRSSFEDGDDPEVVAAEEMRIMEARRKAAQAARAAAGDRDPLSQAKPVGQVSGVDAYRLPAAELSPRGQDKPKAKKRAPAKKRGTAKKKTKGTKNPNFKPSR